MPLYEFQCQDCRKTFEVIVKSSSPEAKKLCPACKSQNTKKLISLSSFHLLGGGWAKDGYGS